MRTTIAPIETEGARAGAIHRERFEAADGHRIWIGADVGDLALRGGKLRNQRRRELLSSRLSPYRPANSRSECRFSLAKFRHVQLANLHRPACSCSAPARANEPQSFCGQSGTITAVVNALAKAGVDLGENGSVIPRPKGGKRG